MTNDDIVAALETLLDAIEAAPDPRRAQAEWKQLYRLLQGTDLPANRVAHTVGMRDLAGLRTLVDQIESPAEAAGPQADAPDTETCRRAMRAFRKRLSLARLDDESRISSHNLLSKGEGSSIHAIAPPDEWPEPVWRELVRRGKLHDEGHGFYSLAKK